MIFTWSIVFYFFIFALAQGVFEFLPVSSSVHLDLITRFFASQGYNFSVNLDFYTALAHLGSLLFLLSLYRKTLWFMLFKPFSQNSLEQGLSPRKLWLIGILTTLVLPLSLIIKTTWVIGLSGTLINLAGFGIILAVCDYYGSKTLSLADMPWWFFLVLALAQAVAGGMEGVSRLGITLSFALAFGLRRMDAVWISFFMAIPALLAAGGHALYHASWHDFPLGSSLAVVIGVWGFSYIGFFLLRSLVQRFGFGIFGLYRLILAVFLWVLYF